MVDMSGRYSIQLASKISGVGVHTIRAWEKRYKAVVPERNDTGRREYTDADIERLSLLSELCTIGHSIGKVATLPTEELRKLLKKLGKNEVQNKQHAKKVESALVDIPQSLQSLLLALKAYKLDIISHEINKLKILLTPRQLALDIISPLLNQVGYQVEKRELSISQEHALSAILKFHMGHLLFRQFHHKSTKPYKVLICSPEGDYHEFGILQAALLCNHYGVHFYYLGPNLPVESLIDAYNSLEANMIILGSTVIPDGQNLMNIENYVDRIIKSLGPDGHLVFGGSVKLEADKIVKSKKISIFANMQLLDEFLKNI
ncbi:MAG: MerR family transcriptional regulator [Bacteriovoracaceae bacterium]